MSAIAARKLRTVIGNVQATLAIELLVAAQAIDWRVGMKRDPNATTDPSRERERGVSDPSRERERVVSGDAVGTAHSLPGGSLSTSDEEWAQFQRVTQAQQRAETAKSLGTGTGAAYLAVRQVAEPMLDDRVLEPDIRAVRRIIADESLLAAVNTASPIPVRPIPVLARPR